MPALRRALPSSSLSSFLSSFLAGVVVAACGGSVASAPDDAGAAASADGGGDGGGGGEAGAGGGGGVVTTPACAAAAGVCLPADQPAPPNRKKTEVPLCEPNHECWVLVTPIEPARCTTDASCNDDPAVSSLQGVCFEGTCICRGPAHVQPNGKCGAAKPPADCRASGGACRQDPAECGQGQLQGGGETSMSCGDFVAAVCCYPADQCKATVDLQCCGARAEPYEPTCVNGWKTCESGAPTPIRRGAGCGG